MAYRVITFLLIIISLTGCAAFADETSPAKDIVVTVEGFAACSSADSKDNCRRAALADALRRAVEKAVGVLVEADTRTKNYQTVQDTVRTTSEGYVRDYRVLDEGSKDNTFRVKIEARIAPGKPEKSLRYYAKRLAEEVKPVFSISTDDPSAGRMISNELSALGLKVASDKSNSSSVITISGRIGIEPLGEVLEGSKIYSSDASSDLTVADGAAKTVLPSVSVALPKPAAALSQKQADRQAVTSVVKLWVQRNLPIIAAALLEPGRPAPLETAQSDKKVTDTLNGISLLIPPPSNLDHGTVSRDGSRLIIDPNEMKPLAWKLRQSVLESSEYFPLPIPVAVSSFTTTGIDDADFANDVQQDLSTALVKMEVFELVERAELDKVLGELRIQNSGMIDSNTAKKLGGLVGAKAILVGNISDRSDRIVITARLINTETGRVRIVETFTLEKDPEPVILKAGSWR